MPHVASFAASATHDLQVFAAELRDFFSASSLTSLLEAARPALASDPADEQLLDVFAGAKAKMDAAGQAATPQQIMDVMHALTRCAPAFPPPPL